MNTAAILAALLVGSGLCLAMVGLLGRGRAREEQLSEILDLPWGEQDVPVAAIAERAALIESTVALAGRMVEQFDAKGTLAIQLERARIPLRPGEYVMATLGAAVVVFALIIAITERWFFAPIGVLATLGVASLIPKRRIAKRRSRFEAQLPDALSLIASSLSAGHTFLRAIQMMCEEAEEPLAEEFSRVVQETRLGDPLVDALDRMATRLEVEDLRWVVQAIRIQQTVGGKLADLLHTLADFIRAREEVRREVKVLTAEGRFSAWVLGALPVFILLSVQVISPDYMQPLYQGWGIVWLTGTALSVCIGVGIILKMVKIEV